MILEELEQERLDNISLAVLKKTIRRLSPLSYEEFIEVLYEDIELAIQALEDDRQLFGNTKMCEDQISSIIFKQLNKEAYDATHDTQIGGHIDALVKCRNNKFRWMAEAKIWKGTQYLTGGMQQLLTRYSNGSESDAGFLIYFREEDNVSSKMADWRRHIIDQSICDHVSSDKSPSPINTNLQMTSVHEVKPKGKHVKTKHFPVCLYFSPEK